MLQSIQHGDYLRAVGLIERSSNVNICDESGETPLIKCMFIKEERKAIGLARALIEHGAKVSLKDKRRLNALHYCCIEQLSALVDVLLSALDGSINSRCCHTGNTALHFSVIVGNQDIACKLINHMTRYKLSVNIRNKAGVTALQLAIGFSHTAIVKLLLSAGADVSDILNPDHIKVLSSQNFKQMSINMLPSREKPKPYLRKRSNTSSITHTSRRAGQEVKESKSSGVKAERLRAGHNRQSNKQGIDVVMLAPSLSWRETLPQMWKRYAQQHSSSYRKTAVVTPMSTAASTSAEPEEKDTLTDITSFPANAAAKRRHSSVSFTGPKALLRGSTHLSSKSTQSKYDMVTNRRRSVAV